MLGFAGFAVFFLVIAGLCDKARKKRIEKDKKK
jgi:hypothetical protein